MFKIIEGNFQSTVSVHSVQVVDGKCLFELATFAEATALSMWAIVTCLGCFFRKENCGFRENVVHMAGVLMMGRCGNNVDFVQNDTILVGAM